MGFWTLFEVASMPMLQVLIISVLGAFLATDYCNLLPATTRKQMNMIVFVVFTPSLMFASLANTVTFQDMLSWWYLPVNISLIFFIGGILGWILVKILKPEPQLEGLVIATCSAGNLGCLLLIVIPAICNENGSPFGDKNICSSVGLSYASFSMALGGFFIWTHTYYLVRTSAIKFREIQSAKDFDSKIPNKDFDANEETSLLKEEKQDQVLLLSNSTIQVDTESQVQIAPQLSGKIDQHSPFWGKIVTVAHQILEEVFAPPTVGSILGFIFGATPWLKGLVIGNDAPLHVIQDTVKLLGDGTIPCITLILGGNLTQGLRSSRLKPVVILGIICVRYMILPIIGIGLVKVAGDLGFLPSDPLFKFVLMVQFTVPPAMNIGTMTQFLDVGQEECSVILLWTYLISALALTAWSTVYMYILS